MHIASDVELKVKIEKTQSATFLKCFINLKIRTPLSSKNECRSYQILTLPLMKKELSRNEIKQLATNNTIRTSNYKFFATLRSIVVTTRAEEHAYLR